MVYTPAANSIQPASIDLSIGNKTLTLKQKPITIGQPEPPGYHEQVWGRAIVIKPNEFLLAATQEYVSIPNGVVAQLSGKSTLARVGLIVHVTAGWIDPGFSGHITLELKNVGPCPLTIPVGSFIAQLAVAEMKGISFPDSYKGKYRGAEGVQGARW
jgi:dCTP deaminase